MEALWLGRLCWYVLSKRHLYLLLCCTRACMCMRVWVYVYVQYIMFMYVYVYVYMWYIVFSLYCECHELIHTITLLGVPRIDTRWWLPLYWEWPFSHHCCSIVGVRFHTHSLMLYCECRSVIHIKLLVVPLPNALYMLMNLLVCWGVPCAHTHTSSAARWGCLIFPYICLLPVVYVFSHAEGERQEGSRCATSDCASIGAERAGSITVVWGGSTHRTGGRGVRRRRRPASADRRATGPVAQSEHATGCSDCATGCSDCATGCSDCATGCSDCVDLRVGHRCDGTAGDVRHPGAGGALTSRSAADATARSDNVARPAGKHPAPDDDADDSRWAWGNCWGRHRAVLCLGGNARSQDKTEDTRGGVCRPGIPLCPVWCIRLGGDGLGWPTEHIFDPVPGPPANLHMWVDSAVRRIREYICRMPSVRIGSVIHLHGERHGPTSATRRRCLAALWRALPPHPCHGARAAVAPDQLGCGDGRYSQCPRLSPGGAASTSALSPRGAAISHAFHTYRRVLRLQLPRHMHPHALSFQARLYYVRPGPPKPHVPCCEFQEGPCQASRRRCASIVLSIT